MTQYVFRFGGGVSDGDETVRGNKNILAVKVRTMSLRGIFNDFYFLWFCPVQ